MSSSDGRLARVGNVFVAYSSSFPLHFFMLCEVLVSLVVVQRLAEEGINWRAEFSVVIFFCAAVSTLGYWMPMKMMMLRLVVVWCTRLAASRAIRVTRS